MRDVASVALLATVAACGGGGGGAAAPAGNSGGAAAAQPAGGSSAAPSITLNQSGNPALLTVSMPDIGVDHTFALTGVGLENASFRGVPIYNLGDASGQTLTHFLIQSDNGGNDVLVYDASGLAATSFGIWSHTDPTTGATRYGAFDIGTPTSATDMAVLKGSASYAGGVIGSGSTGSAQFNLTGTFNALANFDNRTFGWNANLSASDASGAIQPWGTLSSSATISADNSAAITGTVTSSGSSALLPNAVNGTLAGHFHGAGASEVGGAFSVSGGQTTALGAFGGAVQSAASAGGFTGGANVSANFGASGAGMSSAPTGGTMTPIPSGSAFSGSLASSGTPLSGGVSGVFFGSTASAIGAAGSATAVGSFGGAKH
jgi:hypothetical protein